MKANLDQIIEKSLKKTEEMEKQPKTIEDKFNLNQVSLTGDDANTKTSIYQLDGEVIDRKQNGTSAKFVPTFIDIGARNRSTKNYNDNQNLTGVGTTNGNKDLTSLQKGATGTESSKKK